MTLRAVPIEESPPEALEALGRMVDEQLGYVRQRASGHRCWFFVPTRGLCDRIEKYADGAQCPKCGKGRVVIELFKDGTFGDMLWAKCYWGANGCDFAESYYEDMEP